jgi:hypothetical protein
MTEQKQYVPGMFLREKQTKYGTMLNVSIDAGKLAEWMREKKDDKGFVKITIAPRREPKGDITHTAWLDTWKPTRQANNEPERPKLDLSDAPPF